MRAEAGSPVPVLTCMGGRPMFSSCCACAFYAFHVFHAFRDACDDALPFSLCSMLAIELNRRSNHLSFGFGLISMDFSNVICFGVLSSLRCLMTIIWFNRVSIIVG